MALRFGFGLLNITDTIVSPKHDTVMNEECSNTKREPNHILVVHLL